MPLSFFDPRIEKFCIQKLQNLFRMAYTTIIRTSFILCSLLISLSSFGQTTLVPTNANYSYFDGGDAPANDDMGNSWFSADYSSDWSSFDGPLGYGPGEHNEVLNSTANTVYFRHQFEIENTATFDLMFFNLYYNDGAAVYLNGTRIWNVNVPNGDLEYSTPALSNVGDVDTAYIALPHLFVDGVNTLAVELHNSPDEGDNTLSLNLEVIEYHEVCAQEGQACDDNNENTANDTINAACECEGVTCDIVAEVSDMQEIYPGQSVILTASGGTSYFWSTGDTGSSIEVFPGTTTGYLVTVVDENGCEDDAEVWVYVLDCDAVAYAGEDVSLQLGESTTLTSSEAESYEWSTGETTASINVSPAETTTYTVLITNKNGCYAIDEVVVTVSSCEVGAACDDQSDGTYNDSYNADCECVGFPCHMDVEIDGDANILNGQVANIYVEGGLDYIWDHGAVGPNIVVSPTETTTYTVTIIGDNGCQEITFFTVNVDGCLVGASCDDGRATTYGDTYKEDCSCSGFDCSMDIEVTGNNQIQIGESTTLMAEGGVSYTWSNGMTGPNIEVSPSVTTNYTVVIIDANGCGDVGAILVTVLDCEVGATCDDSNGDTYDDHINDACECVGFPCHMDVEISGDNIIRPGESATISAEGGTSYTWDNGMVGPSIKVSPESTTTYTVTITTSNGCEDTASFTVFVNECAVELIIDGETEIYLGQTTDITVSGGVEYLWDDGSTSPELKVSPAVTTDYTVTVTDEHGCSEIATVTVEIIECIVPVEAERYHTIVEGETISLVVGGGNYYEWSNGGIGSTIRVAPVQNTTYEVTVFLNGYCFEIVEIEVEVILDVCPLGGLCDDNDPSTINDAYNENCECVGEPMVNQEGNTGGSVANESADNYEVDCTPITSYFPRTTLKHYGSDYSMTALDFANIQSGVSFTISGLSKKETSTSSNNYVDVVDVTYINQLGQEISYGTFDARNVNEVQVSIEDYVQGVIVKLSDGLDGFAPKINVKLSNISSCSSTQSASVVGSNGLAAAQTDLIEASLVSNLTNGRLILDIENPNDSAQEILVSIVDANGIPVSPDAMSGFVLPGSQSEYIDIANLKPGMYYLKIQVGRQIITLKFVAAD